MYEDPESQPRNNPKQYINEKQQIYKFQHPCQPNKQIILTSNFESGNLKNYQVQSATSQNIHLKLWVGSDTNCPGYRTWFYFGVQGISVNTTVTFTIMNMSNQVKLFKEGHMPVYRIGNNQHQSYKNPQKQWKRIKIPLQQNAFVKTQNGFQLTFKHYFNVNDIHYFAFTYPWTISDQQNHIKMHLNGLSESKIKKNLYVDYQQFCRTYENRAVKLLTISYMDPESNNQMQVIKMKQSEQKSEKQINQNYEKLTMQQIVGFKNKKGIFISARVHPGEVAASYILNGLLDQLFTFHPHIISLLKKFTLYIIPILNPDGVALGNFRTDALGINLNRCYSAPHRIQQPQIYHIKNMLVKMIKLKHIDFCLDIHAHVNKQGAFIYGNSLDQLDKQTQVLLLPRILQFNSEYFDYDACNFSSSNMGKFTKKNKEQQPQNNKNKDENDKQGSARVAIYKQTGLTKCWTLQCNYNSCKFSNLLPPLTQQNHNSSVSHGVISSRISPETKNQIKIINMRQFQSIGKSVLESICDYYEVRSCCRIFGTKLKNMNNFRINTAIAALRLLPFRFDSKCRKILVNINSQIQLKQCLVKLSEMLSIKNNEKVAEKNPPISKSNRMIPNRVNSHTERKENNLPGVSLSIIEDKKQVEKQLPIVKKYDYTNQLMRYTKKNVEKNSSKINVEGCNSKKNTQRRINTRPIVTETADKYIGVTSPSKTKNTISIQKKISSKGSNSQISNKNKSIQWKIKPQALIGGKSQKINNLLKKQQEIQANINQSPKKVKIQSHKRFENKSQHNFGETKQIRKSSLLKKIIQDS